MRVLLIATNAETMNMVPLPLGLNCVAVAAQRSGHQVEVIDPMGEESASALIGAAVARLRPDVIGVSARNGDDQRRQAPRFLLGSVPEVIATCRRLSDSPIVVGGAAYSIFPEAALRYLGADLGIRGEGEAAFVALLDRLERRVELSGIPGLFAPKQASRDHRSSLASLDSPPLPDPALWGPSARLGKEICVPFQTRRGCPMKCTYCTTPGLEGRRIRTRSAKAAVEGIARHREAGFRHFYFADNVFNLPKPYAKELCAALAEARLTSAGGASSAPPGSTRNSSARWTRRAASRRASLGFESGSERVLRNLGKSYSTADVRAAAELLARRGIRRVGFLLLGGPGETRESVRESLAFADSLDLELMRITAGIRLYPGTALARAAQKEGAIATGDDLLAPKFYLAPALAGWIDETVGVWCEDRPNWIV